MSDDEKPDMTEAEKWRVMMQGTEDIRKALERAGELGMPPSVQFGLCIAVAAAVAHAASFATQGRLLTPEELAHEFAQVVGSISVMHKSTPFPTSAPLGNHEGKAS